MPNLNVKGDAPKAGGGSAAAGEGGIPKVVLIAVIAIVALGAIAFILNTTGVVKLWGKKKPTPQVVALPEENYTPVTPDTAVYAEQQSPATEESVMPLPGENTTTVETNARPETKKPAPKNIVSGTGMYTVQISSWPAEEKANAQARLFADAGFESFVEPLGNYYRVCVGRFETKADAKSQLEKMEHMLESRPVVAKIGK